jgi:hypothetical protein
MIFIDEAVKENLKSLGYRWEYDTNSYRVWHGKNFIHGASVLLPRDKPLHWRHRIANLKDNFEHCIRVCQRHQALKGN